MSLSVSTGLSKTNFGRKISNAKKFYEFVYSMKRSVRPWLVYTFGPLITVLFCLQCMVLNFDYHHPYPEYMKTVLWVISIVCDPFFWVDSYLDQYLFAVILGIWFVLLLDLFVIYVYFTSGLSDRFYELLALLLKLIQTVLLVPLLQLFFKSYRCKIWDGSFELYEFSGGDHHHNCLEFPYIVVAIMCTAIIISLVIVVAFFSLLVPDNLHTSRAISSTPTGRWHAIWVIGISFIVLSKVFLSSGDSYVRMLTPIFSLVINLILFSVLFLWFPYFWKISNFMVGLTFALSMAGCLSGIVTEILSEEDYEELLEYIIGPSVLIVLMVLFGVLATMCLCCRYFCFCWGLFVFKKSRNFKATKVMLRLMGVKQFALFLPYCTTRELEVLDLELEEIYGKSVMARVFLILRCFEKNSFDGVRLKSIVRRLMQSQLVQERVSWDISVFLYSVGERVVEMDFGDSSGKMIVKQVSRANKYEFVVRKSLKKIFGCYMNEGIRIKTLSSLFDELDENDSACHKIYKRVLKNNSESALVLRRYGKYLLEIRLDPLKADSYLRQSMSLEKAHMLTDDNTDQSDEAMSSDGSSFFSHVSSTSTLSQQADKFQSQQQAPQQQGAEASGNVSPSGSDTGSAKRNATFQSPASVLSTTSGVSTKYNNYLEPASHEDEGTDLSSHQSSFDRASVISSTTLSNKKKLATRLSRENLFCTTSLCVYMLILFLVSVTTLTLVFTFGYVSWGLAGSSQEEIFKIHDLSEATVRVSISASQVASNWIPDQIDIFRDEFNDNCASLDELSREVYREADHQDLFQKKYDLPGIDGEVSLIDALGAWRKFCELFMMNLNYHQVNYNNISYVQFIYENGEYMTDILRTTVDDYVDKVDSSVRGFMHSMWIMQLIVFVFYPIVFIFVIYFCLLERSLFKLLLVIPKNAIYDTYRGFGGGSVDNTDTKSIRARGNFGTLSKLCIYLCAVFAGCWAMVLILCLTTQLAGENYFSFLRKESVTSQYYEKFNLVYFYLNDYRNPYHSFYQKNESSTRILEILGELDEVNEQLRFGTDDFGGSDGVSELHSLYYDSKCETPDSTVISIEDVTCYSFNQRIDAHRQAVEYFIDEDGVFGPEEKLYIWGIIYEIHSNDTYFVDLVKEIDEVQLEEFEELISSAFAFLTGFYISSLFLLLFVFLCILCRYPWKVRRHLYRIRSAFLYLDNKHLLDNRLYRILTNPPSLIPWLSFNRLGRGFIEMKEKQTRALIEGLPVYATVIFDNFKRIRFLNNEAKNMIGLPNKKLAYGMRITSFFVDPSKLRAWMRSGESDTFTGEMEMNTIHWKENILEDEVGEESKYDSGMNHPTYDESFSGEKKSGSLSDPEFSRKLEKMMNDNESSLRKNMNKFHARVAVVRQKGRYLAVMKNIETEIHQKQLVEHEKKRSEDYLYNILPKKIAKSFFTSPESNTFVVHQEVTVVFQDIVAFTFYSSHTQPELIIAILNELFKGIDELCVKNKMEKIKTIGDAYLAACGVPEYVHDHAKWSFRFARECIQFLYQFNFQKQRDFKLRSGIHTGKVVAGVIGKYKYQYDIWGDAVNMAARMEQTGVPDKIQVSRETYAYLYQDHQFVEREVFVKGKGNQKVYMHTVENSFVEPNLHVLEREDLLEEEVETPEQQRLQHPQQQSQPSQENLGEEVIDDMEMRQRESELRKRRLMDILQKSDSTGTLVMSPTDPKQPPPAVFLPKEPTTEDKMKLKTDPHHHMDEETEETELIPMDPRSVTSIHPPTIDTSKRPPSEKLEKELEIKRIREEMMEEMQQRMQVQVEYERQQRENWLNREKQKLEMKRRKLEDEKLKFDRLKKEQDRASPIVVPDSTRSRFGVNIISSTPDSLRGMRRSFSELEREYNEVKTEMEKEKEKKGKKEK